LLNSKQQYRYILLIYRSFEKNKLVENIRIKEEDFNYSKAIYRYSRFENYTKENYLSLLIYVNFKNNPKSVTDFLKMLNGMEKKDLLDSINFKNKIINAKNTLQKDKILLQKINPEYLTNEIIYELYKEDKISPIGFYFEINKSKQEIKGMRLKKDIKKVQALLKLFKNTENTENTGD